MQTIKIRKLLLPLSWLYGVMVCLRNKLFDWKILPAEQFDVPVISVGNLTVGGTGKTPHTEYLIRLLSSNYRVAVLSRGYKRKSKGYLLADATATVAAIGDEPFQMHRKFPNILVAVDSNRRRGIRNLLALPEKQRPEVVLLDDAFQHRYVKPSLSVLLMNSQRLPQNDALLPAGRLREPARNAKRANIIIYTKCGDRYKVQGKLPFTLYPLPFYTTYRYGDLLPVFGVGSSLRRFQIEKKSVLLIAGLADPTDFIRYVKKTYATDLQTLIFSDHHNFTERDAEEIEKIFQQMRRRLEPTLNDDATPNAEVFKKLPPEEDEGLIITSEKDAVRLQHLPFLSEEIKKKLFYLPVEVQFLEGQEEKFKQIIEHHVRQFKRNSSVFASEDSGRNENRYHFRYRIGRFGKQYHG